MKNKKRTKTQEPRDKFQETSKDQSVKLQRVNWVGAIPAKGSKLQARTRYRQELQDIKIISIEGDTAVVEFKRTQETITPGQSLVMYEGEECVGGGIIE